MGLRRWLGYETDLLISPLPLEACMTQLKGAAAEDGVVVAAIGANSLRLRKRLEEESHNSFQTYLRATLHSEGNATRLNCRFGPHPFVMVFMVFWFLLALGIAAAILVISSSGTDAGEIPSIAAMMPFMMAPMGIVVVAIGRRFARGERQYLLDFLSDTIAARPAPASRPGPTGAVVQR